MRFCAALSADNTDARPERAHNVRYRKVKASVVSAPVVGEAMTTGLLWTSQKSVRFEKSVILYNYLSDYGMVVYEIIAPKERQEHRRGC